MTVKTGGAPAPRTLLPPTYVYERCPKDAQKMMYICCSGAAIAQCKVGWTCSVKMLERIEVVLLKMSWCVK